MAAPDGLTMGAAQVAAMVARDSRARLLAILAAQSRDLAASEDALSDAFAQALRLWPLRGVPDRPEAWLLTVARRAVGAAGARNATARRAQPALWQLADEAQSRPDDPWPDRRLGLFLACTHPAVDPGARVALMLQVVLGLTADRIAPAFLLTPAALGQRLARAKARLRAQGVAFVMPEPADLARGLPDVLEAIHAAAALGWEAVPGSDPARSDLSDEALHLARTMAALVPEATEARALVALILYVRSRAAARTGGYVPLAEQDVTRWDRAAIAEADGVMMRLGGAGVPGRFQLEAAIQSVHAERARTGVTNWAALETLHAALARVAPTHGAAVAAAAVLLERQGPAACLVALDGMNLSGFQPAAALRAEALRRAGDPVASRAALQLATGLAEDPALKAWLSARLAAL